MKKQLWLGACVLATLVNTFVSLPASAQYGTEMISYTAGSTPVAGFTNSSAVLGSPERFTGESGNFPGVVSPFNPPFQNDEIVSIGESGQLTLRLSHYAIPQAAGPEIGVFANVGLGDLDFPNGQAGSPAGGFGIDSAVVEVSEDGSNWTSLGSQLFDVPTNGYTDVTNPFSGVPGSVLSDFQQPFVGSLSSFDGLAYASGSPSILDVLAGSGGGTWLDISGTGLAQVGYIRFAVADDGNAANDLNFELDAVSIARFAQGAPTVPEPATISLSLLASALALSARRRARRGG